MRLWVEIWFVGIMYILIKQKGCYMYLSKKNFRVILIIIDLFYSLW